MNKIDLEALQRLLNYGRTDEARSGGYPNGMDGDAPASHMDHLQTNGMGDNSLRDPSIEGASTGKAGAVAVDPEGEEEEQKDSLKEMQDAPQVSPELAESVHQYLGNLGVTDSDIAMGEFGTDSDGNITVGDQSIPNHEVMEVMNNATGMALSEADAVYLMHDCLDFLSGNMNESMGFPRLEKKLDEFRKDGEPVQQRFTHTIDSLGNVVIQDNQAGTEVYLQGQDAMDLISQIPDGASEGQIQHVLSQYQHVMEDGEQLDEYAPKQVTTSVVSDVLGELLYNVSRLDQDLRQALQGARKTGDSHAYFAFEHFHDQIKGLGNDIQAYMDKYTKK